MNLLRLLLLIAPMAVPAGANAQNDPAALQWLQRIHLATQKLSYTGTFVYQHDNQMETSRITRVVTASGPVEKLEALDGIPREIIRTQEEVVCYFPASMTMKVDKLSGRKPFPGILPEQVRELVENYVIRLDRIERVAGYACQIVALEPRDKIRYGHKLCADVKTGMLLKAKTTDDRDRLMESFAFTHLQIGGNIDRDRIRPGFIGKGGEWRIEDSGATETNLGQAGWTVRAQLPGFRKVIEMTRTLGTTAGVGHMVFSDGLAAVSVFIEPAQGSQRQSGLSRQGAINVFARDVDGHRITVVGETPAESVRFIANAVEFRKPQ